MNVIFDLDGTLIDSSERMYRLFQDLVPESSFSKDEYWALKRNKVNHKHILEEYFPGHSYKTFNDLWMHSIEKEEYLDMDTNYDDTLDVLRYFHGLKDCSIVLLTARQSKENLTRELQRLKIHDYFERILVTEGSCDKEELLKKTNSSELLADASGSLFVSDMGKDIELGNKKGFVTVGISHGFTSKEKLLDYNPTFLVDHLSQIIVLI